MSRSLRIEYAGAFYHVTSRGNERKAVFRTHRDREKFLSYLESATERYRAVVHVYCLMNNHYRWSSCQYYMFNRGVPTWLRRDFILSYFGRGPKTAMKRYKDFIHSVMDQDCKNPLVDLANSVILGGDAFIEEIKSRYLRNKQPDRELPILRDLSDRPELSQIVNVVDSVLQSNKKLARQVKLHMCHRHSGMKLKEIGEHFGIGESGVTYASNRIGMKAEKDKKLREIVKTIEAKIFLSNV